MKIESNQITFSMDEKEDFITLDKLEVGQSVYLKAVGNNARWRDGLHISEDVITKVGRKYFEVGDGRKPLKFHIDDLTQETGGYIADWKLYFSKQDILDEEEFEKLKCDIRMKFDSYGKLNMSLDQLRRIKTIIDEQ